VGIELSGSCDRRDADEVWPVYDEVFGDHPEAGWRADVWDRHVTRDGFRLARVRDESGLAGFAYGYTGERGQWWTDRACEVLPDRVAAEWLGGHFEVVSVAVLPRARRTGLGAGLVKGLTRDLPHERLLLMTTADPDHPARRLYARAGWREVGPGFRSDQVILGKRSPRASAR
jgi:GNAT superfamily N-acetyltransferase